jgi:hypothetical protein
MKIEQCALQTFREKMRELPWRGEPAKIDGRRQV